MNRYFLNNSDARNGNHIRRIVVFKANEFWGRAHFNDGSEGCIWNLDEMDHRESDFAYHLFTEITLPEAIQIWPGILSLS